MVENEESEKVEQRNPVQQETGQVVSGMLRQLFALEVKSKETQTVEENIMLFKATQA